MASYGYGYGGSPSQGYSTVQPPGSYQSQPSGSGFTPPPQYGNQQQRPLVQPTYNVAGPYPSSNYGYGRQQDPSNITSAQNSYGQSAYVAREPVYDSSKQQGYYPASSQGTGSSYGYGSSTVKQQSYQPVVVPNAPMYANTSQSLSHGSSNSSQGGNSATSYTGYNARGQSNQGGSYGDAGYNTPAPANAATTPQKDKGASQSQMQNAYEPVVYNAATSFLQQQSEHTKPQWQRHPKPQFRLPAGQRRGPGSQLPSRAEQLHYCELCKISCAGPQTYKEHLEGQKHKKKEASSSAQKNAPVPAGSYRCLLCTVTCTGADAYNAHVKGARHQKAVKLHQKLGKPIPENKGPPVSKNNRADNSTVASSTKVSGPKINFVGGTKLYTTDTGAKEETESTESAMDSSLTTEDDAEDVPEESGKIVGEEFVTPLDDQGSVPGFMCSLCDCRFNDDVARTAHLKGRRHHLSYKKQVKPDFVVSFGNKGKLRSTGMRDERGMRLSSKELMWRQRQQQHVQWEQQLRMRENELRRWEEEEYMKKVEEDRYWTRPDRQRPLEMENYESERAGHNNQPLMGHHGPHGPSAPTPDDRIVMAKHGSVYPTDAELKQVQTAVAATEKALKLVSDRFSEEGINADATVPPQVPSSPKDSEKEVEGEKEVEEEDSTTTSQRSLKGVMRVGVLAKGLLLRGQLNVELVVLCTEAPTNQLFNRVLAALPEKLLSVSEDTFTVETKNDQIIVKTTSEPLCSVVISLTSPVVREGDDEPIRTEPEAIADEASSTDVLAKEQCLKALASLRHAKWFQAKANVLQSCVIVIRVLRDFHKAVPAFYPISDWMIELLVEKALSSPVPFSPGEAFRRVLEVLSAGLLLPGGSGLIDPCEKDVIDAAGSLSAQERENVTAAAQGALRQMAFRQLAHVLRVDESEVFKSRVTKRRRDSDATALDTDAKCQRSEEAAEDISEAVEVETPITTS